MSAFSRRDVLRGAGVAIALPWFESLLAPRVFARSRALPEAPLRIVFVYLPNGAYMAGWTPKETGATFALPTILEPLEPVRSEVLVLSGLAHDQADGRGDGTGDHARASAVFLTAAHPYKSAGADIRAGISVDQLAAKTIGARTRWRSLELGCEGGTAAGLCDAGYACSYSTCLAWATPHTPLPKEVDPRIVFERLFLDGDATGTPEGRARRAAKRKSILDFVREDAASIGVRLGAADRRKLDEYLSAVRELERRIDFALQGSAQGVDGFARPQGIPPSRADHVRLIYDLLALALRGDSTRIATLMLANEQSGASHPFLDAPEGHHELSHHGGDPEKLAKIARINRFHVAEFARFLAALQSAREGEESLLDRSMIVFGSGISDGNAHDHVELPVLFAGRGGGTITTGRHLRFASKTPMANLYVSMLERLGIPTASFGDSTGPLVELA